MGCYQEVPGGLGKRSGRPDSGYMPGTLTSGSGWTKSSACSPAIQNAGGGAAAPLGDRCFVHPLGYVASAVCSGLGTGRRGLGRGLEAEEGSEN